MKYARSLALIAVLGCGSSQSTTAIPPADQSAAQLRAEQVRKEKERAEHAANVNNHRKLESAQQDALGATCDDAAKWAEQHCTPSCYPVEPKDPRAGTKVAGAVHIQHLVCQRADDGPWLVIDELDPKLTTKPARGRRPKPHKKGSWQADVAAAVDDRDVVIVAGARRTMRHPLTRESLQCVTVTRHANAPRGKLEACGAAGRKTTCEVAGNAAARGINLVRYRLAEAAQLRDAGKEPECQAAALDALATARGLPRWRQYAKLNVGEWTEGLAYKTRFDGILDEDSLFALATTLGTEAEQLYAACGGASPRTTPEQEHAFHSCP